MVLGIFLTFVLFIVGLSFYLGRQTKTSSGYYAAGGQIHWFVNGIAFAGDYLSAASFLGICGMIATTGYDGFLYSIGFLAGWVESPRAQTAHTSAAENRINSPPFKNCT